MKKIFKNIFPPEEGIMPYVGLGNMAILLYFILLEPGGKLILGLFFMATLLILYRQVYWSPHFAVVIVPIELMITLVFGFYYHPMYLYIIFIFVYQIANLPLKWMYIFCGCFILSGIYIAYHTDIFEQFYMKIVLLPPLFGGSIMPFILRAQSRYKEMSKKLAQTAEQLDKKNKELILAEESKRKTLADLSHDLKTPMTTIQGYSKLLYDGIVEDPDQKKKYLKYIYDKSIRVTSLIDELFMFSKLDTPDFQVHRDEKDFCEFVREAIAESYHLFDEKHMQVIIDIPKTKMFLSFDQKLFYRVISNLLENAVKYNPEKTHFFIRLRKSSDFLFLELADNGVKISEELAENIFEPFVRGDKSRNEDDGSGLGLSISKKVVELHNGNIQLDTKPQKWSKRFIIELPI